VSEFSLTETSAGFHAWREANGEHGRVSDEPVSCVTRITDACGSVGSMPPKEPPGIFKAKRFA
jgi:hypothetical protein